MIQESGNAVMFFAAMAIARQGNAIRV